MSWTMYLLSRVKNCSFKATQAKQDILHFTRSKLLARETSSIRHQWLLGEWSSYWGICIVCLSHGPKLGVTKASSWMNFNENSNCLFIFKRFGLESRTTYEYSSTPGWYYAMSIRKHFFKQNFTVVLNSTFLMVLQSDSCITL